MKNISRVILLSTSCLIWYGADNVCASVNVYSGIPKSGTNTHYTTHLTEPHLPHPRTLFNSLPEIGRVREGMSSEASISLSSKIDNVSLTGQFGIITPLLTSPTLGEEYKEASVCFITDAGNCSGKEFSSNETPDGNQKPDYKDPGQQCLDVGYGVTSCPAGSHGDNPCPADSAYYQKCVCDANITQTCTKPYYGVGPSCNGKYASCKRDDAKACKEDGFSQTTQCSSVQTPNRKCSYNSGYYDKCVCRSDLVTCTYPQTGVGEACGGKYASCQCPSSYKSCECGGAAGATSCTVNGVTTYSSCKECCKTSCPGGYDNSTIPNGYVQDGEACNHCSFGLRYKIKPNPCTGFQKCQFGAESGAKTCLSGSTTMYDKCRPCNNACPSGTSESNPGGCGGSTTNECGTKTCYYPYQACCSDYCSSGSIWVNCGEYEIKTPVGKTECGNTCYECREHNHTISCPSGYTENICDSTPTKACFTVLGTSSGTCSECGKRVGHCVKCLYAPMYCRCLNEETHTWHAC